MTSDDPPWSSSGNAPPRPAMAWLIAARKSKSLALYWGVSALATLAASTGGVPPAVRWRYQEAQVGGNAVHGGVPKTIRSRICTKRAR